MKTISAKPLFDRFKKRGAKAEFARSINISMGSLSNWRVRGIPAYMVKDVADKLKMSVEDYYRIASDGSADNKITTEILPDSEGEKLLVLLRTFLDTERESRDEIIHVAKAIQGENGTARSAGNPGHPKGRRKPKGR